MIEVLCFFCVVNARFAKRLTIACNLRRKVAMILSLNTVGAIKSRLNSFLAVTAKMHLRKSQSTRKKEREKLVILTAEK